MKRKIVTICGSMRFIGKMQEMSERLQLEQGCVVLGVVPHVSGRDLTDAEKAVMGEMHLARIDLSDAIFVVNPGGYVGDAVKREIAYARLKGKEILYLEPPAQKA